MVNQNNGKGIDFKLNLMSENIFSFENLSNDFPKKIIYTKVKSDELFIQVLGVNDKKFSYKLFKQ